MAEEKPKSEEDAKLLRKLLKPGRKEAKPETK